MELGADKQQDKSAAGRAGAPGGRKRLLMATANMDLFSDVIDSLRRHFNLVIVNQGWAALEEVRKGSCYAAIVDAGLPEPQGIYVAQRLRRVAYEANVTLPYMMVTATVPSSEDERIKYEQAADRFMAAPLDPANFMNALWGICDIQAEQEWDKLNYVQSSVLKVAKRNLEKIFEGAVETGVVEPALSLECSRALVSAARSNDLNGILVQLRNHHSYSFCHSLKVSAVMTLFGREVGLKDSDLELLAQGGLLHDVGKMVTAKHLLDKPSKLTPEEWEQMRKHVEYSGRILRESGDVPIEAIHIAERHHEKMDGSGYPYGLKGGQMDDPSLISAMVDVYSALTDKRSYKPPFSPEKSVEIMMGMSGHHLEPGFLERFREMVMEGIIE